MTPLQRLQLEQSEKRQKINDLLGKAELTEEERAELETLTKRMQEIEVETRAAIVADGQPTETRIETPELDEQAKERLELRSKCMVSTILAAALAGRAVAGPEAELQQELGFAGSDIPTELWQRPEIRQAEDGRETRAITPTPGAAGVNMAEIEPFVFAPSIASRLMIGFRNVPSGTYAVPTITTAPSSAAPKAKSADADATAGVIGVNSATPKRVPARLELAVEDIAAFGNETFESGLRESLSMRLSHSIDDQIINGDGTAPNLSGLLNQLADPSANPAAVVNWAAFVSTLAAFVEGNWATMWSELACVVGPQTYRKALTTFRDPVGTMAQGYATPGDMSAAAYLAAQMADFWTNERMPVTATSGTFNKSQFAIVCRKGHPGLTRAIIPDWGRISIDDIYSGSAKGERYFTVSAILGDVILVQSNAYAQTAFRLAA